MLHDVWFWVAAVEAMILLGIAGAVIWAVRTMPPAPPRRVGSVRGKHASFDVVAQIGHKTGEVHINFDKSVTEFSITPKDARFMAKIFGNAANCAEGHTPDPSLPEPKEVRPTAWDRLR